MSTPSITKKKKVNRADFMFTTKTGETLVKVAPQINGAPFNIRYLEDCTVHILDHSAQVQVDQCKNCTIIVGPVTGSIFVRDCTDCTIHVACGQFRCRDFKNSTVYLCAMNDPVIEASSGLRIAPFNVAYHGLEEQARAAKLDPAVNKWELVFDFSANSDAHFALVDPADFHTIKQAVPGFDDTEEQQLVFGLPARYGGQLSDARPESSAENDGMQKFDITNTSQDVAALKAQASVPVTTALPAVALQADPVPQAQQTFEPEQTQQEPDNFASFSQPEPQPEQQNDFAFSQPEPQPSQQNEFDAFSQPDPFQQQDNLAAFTEQPVVTQEDEFAAFSQPAAQIPEVDSFANFAEPQMESQAPVQDFGDFGQAQQFDGMQMQPQNEMSADALFAQQNFQAPDDGENYTQEELQQMASVEAARQQRTQALYQKQQDEQTQKQARRAAGLAALQEIQARRAKGTVTRRQDNEVMEQEFFAERERTRQSRNQWDRVVLNIDLKNSETTRDITRMREAILARKSDLTNPSSKKMAMI